MSSPSQDSSLSEPCDDSAVALGPMKNEHYAVVDPLTEELNRHRLPSWGRNDHPVEQIGLRMSLDPKAAMDPADTHSAPLSRHVSPLPAPLGRPRSAVNLTAGGTSQPMLGAVQYPTLEVQQAQQPSTLHEDSYDQSHLQPLGALVPISASTARAGLSAPSSPNPGDPKSLSPATAQARPLSRQSSGSTHRSSDRAYSSSSSKRKAEDTDTSDEEPVPLLGNAFKALHRKRRHKCTPEQIEKLEAFFVKNRNPTGQVRAQLAQELLMPERSIQIWMQNKRAKVKRKGGASAAPPPSSAAESSKAGASRSPRTIKKPAPLRNVPTAESVTVLPAYSLCIGTWRRVGLLICFFSRRLQNLTWYLQSESVGYKLETPWSIVQKISFDGPFTPTVPEQAEGVEGWIGHLSITVARSPTFFMEVFRSDPSAPTSTDGQKRTAAWRQCADFTEGLQATQIMTHIVAGPYEELREAVRQLNEADAPFRGRIDFKDHAVQAQLQNMSSSDRMQGQQASLSAMSYPVQQPMLASYQPIPTTTAPTPAPHPAMMRTPSWDPHPADQLQRTLGQPLPTVPVQAEPARAPSSPEQRSSNPYSLSRIYQASGPPTGNSAAFWPSAGSPTNSATFFDHARQSSFGMSAYSSLMQSHPTPTFGSSDSGFFAHARMPSWWDQQPGYNPATPRAAYHFSQRDDRTPDAS